MKNTKAIARVARNATLTILGIFALIAIFGFLVSDTLGGFVAKTGVSVWEFLCYQWPFSHFSLAITLAVVVVWVIIFIACYLDIKEIPV